MPKQPFVPVAGVCRVRYSGLFQASPWVNLFHIQYTGTPPDVGVLNGLAVSLRTTWTTALAPTLTTQTTLVRVDVWDLSSENGSTGADVVGSAGTIAPANVLPRNAAICVSWPVVGRWRGGHFRTYLTAGNIADVTNGSTITSTALSRTQTAANNFLTGINALSMGGSNIKLCGVRYFPTGTFPKTSGTPYPYLTPKVHNRLDTQRRRLGKELV